MSTETTNAEALVIQFSDNPIALPMFLINRILPRGFEKIVEQGMAEDGTREIGEFIKRHSCLRIVDNFSQIVAGRSTYIREA